MAEGTAVARRELREEIILTDLLSLGQQGGRRKRRMYQRREKLGCSISSVRLERLESITMGLYAWGDKKLIM